MIKIMLQRCLAVFFGLIIAFLLAEIGVRSLLMHSVRFQSICHIRTKRYRIEHIQKIETLLKYSPFPTKPKSNYFGFIRNSKGFRTHEYSINKTPGTKRIVVIGDSFAESCGPLPYPFHFTALLQKLFDEKTNEKAEIINLGIAGIGPFFEKKILEIEAIHLNPDIILWFFFVGNDFVDDIHLLNLDEKPYSPVTLNKCYTITLLKGISKYLKFIISPEGQRKKKQIHKVNVLLKDDRHLKPGTYVGNIQDFDPELPSMSKSQYLEIQRGRIAIYDQNKFPWTNWKFIQKTLKKVNALCKERHIKLLFFIIPDEMQLNEMLLNETASLDNIDTSTLDLNLPQKLLGRFFEENRMRDIDLLPIFKKRKSSNPLYLKQDTHWNAFANKLVANIIFQNVSADKMQLKRYRQQKQGKTMPMSYF